MKQYFGITPVETMITCMKEKDVYLTAIYEQI